MIRSITPADARQVAEIHMAVLQTPFRGRIGCEILSSYYRAIATGDGGCGYVYESPDVRIIGFVCGVWDSKALRKRLLRLNLVQLVLLGCAYFLSHPLAAMASLHGRLSSHQSQIQGAEKEQYELRPIAVRADQQGRGVAGQLLKTLLKDAKERGFSSLHLVAAVDNHRANAFYRKCGFSLQNTENNYHRYRIQF